jgi:hypothetical protein
MGSPWSCEGISDRGAVQVVARQSRSVWAASVRGLRREEAVQEGEDEVVTVGPTVLGEMQLPFHLRGDGQDIGGHTKKEGY